MKKKLQQISYILLQNTFIYKVISVEVIAKYCYMYKSLHTFVDG